jgi:lipopolysaccharide/colanic/teichoic acid biosynthesis glycosyltransferase
MTYHATKRGLDLTAASLALVLLLPLMLVIALAIALASRAAPLFSQRRVGRFGREFRMWKFRTMVADAEDRRSELIARSLESEWLHLEHDPRVTRMGRVLRRTSLDELPQLFNVVRADMSLVGPRPLPPVEQAALPAWSRPRLDVRPGLTGLWQVNGRTELDLQAMLRLDCQYVSDQSLRADLRILVLTVPAVLTGRGAN